MHRSSDLPFKKSLCACVSVCVCASVCAGTCSQRMPQVWVLVSTSFEAGSLVFICCVHQASWPESKDSPVSASPLLERGLGSRPECSITSGFICVLGIQTLPQQAVYLWNTCFISGLECFSGRNLGQGSCEAQEQ